MSFSEGTSGGFKKKLEDYQKEQLVDSQKEIVEDFQKTNKDSQKDLLEFLKMMS